MKKILYITYMLLALSFTGYGQDDHENYVKTQVYLTPNPVYDSGVRDTINAQISVSYLDGLGRPVQQIAVRAGGDKKDIITHMEYDIYGRQAKQYLPYSTGSYDMMYDDAALSHTNSFYAAAKYENTTNPYSETFFEDSPLSRVKKTAAPGVPWKGNADTDNNPDNDGDHTVKTKYTLCVKSDYVRHFYVDFPSGHTESPVLAVNGYYQLGELYKTITKDENWVPADGVNKTTEEFTDKLGHLILKRNYNAGAKHDTYYVYDKYNNLTYVIPPLASDQIVYTEINNNFLGVAFPWVSLSYVSQGLADNYNRALADYDNTEILNVDLLDAYGGQGGFSIVPVEDGGLALNLNIITSQPMPLRKGIIADLKSLGNFEDKELGRISGSNFEYYFFIRDNTIVVDGSGSVPSQYLNTTLTGDTPLDYARNYPWTSFCKGDGKIMNQYVKDIAPLDNSEILTTYTPNSYHALGGVAVSLDEEDDLTISFNMSTNTPMELVSGAAFPLEFGRSLPDTVLGTIQGTGYQYEFSIRNNNLYVSGSGLVSHLNFWTTRRFYLRETIKSQVRDGLCYIYHYDKRNRTVEKKVPGKGWEYMVYDRLDRIAATQDQIQRDNHQWLFTKYEPKGRVAYTGMFSDTSTRTSLQGKYNSTTQVPGLYESRVKLDGSFTKSGATVQYTDDNYPSVGNMSELFTVAYYDSDYQIDMDGLSVPTTVPNPIPTTNTLSLTIGSKVRVLGSQLWIYTMKGYDERGREIWSHTKNNYLGSQDITRTTYDFTSRVVATKNTHKKTGLPDFDMYNAYQYDNQGRVLKHRQSQTPMSGWDLGPYQHVIAENHYDELGMLESKGVGGKTSAAQRLQTIDYTYNVRGWLKGINNIATNLLTSQDLFAFRINYNTTNLSGSVPLYNGNISETRWKTKHDNVLRSYGYTYDALNRLSSAKYNGSSTNGYTEGPVAYDKNGNIKSLKRYGYTSASILDLIDNLTYSYGSYSNQLLKVSDAAGADGFTNGTNTGNDYFYDGNGNMLYDLNKKIGELGSSQYIAYNHLNLPTDIYFGTASNKYIRFTYDATGAKLEKKVTNGSMITTTQYDNGFVYEKVNTGANQLKFFNHPEGYAMAPLPSAGVYNPDNFKYIYQYKDHLGNIRLSYTDNNGNGSIAVDGSEIVSENNYYAFGMEHKGYNSTVLPIGSDKAQQYRYNGKELMDELGLNIYDFGARNYDPALGRWMNLDPLAEQMRRFSPYNYAFDNPVYFVDPDGMAPEDFIFLYTDKNGKIQEYRFTGKSGSNAPTQFIQNFQDAYFYNVNNGGGQSMKAIAENKNISVGINESSLYSTQENSSYGDKYPYNVINWNPKMGLETSNGAILSPATVLDHESDHALQGATRPNTKDKAQAKEDSNYNNQEEKRVITGSEQVTAKANGEIGANDVTRTDHKGLPVITTSPTSNTVNRKATYQFHESRKYKNENFSIDYKKYKI